MKRRSLLQALAATPAAAAAAQSAAPAPSTDAPAPPLRLASVEAGATGIATFFTPSQLDALAKLSDAIVPASATRPAASQAGVPEFLDFLISESAADVQALYRQGLDRLAREGVNDTSLAPLTQPWTYAGPGDHYAQFLLRAKADVIQAAMNSREWAESLGRGRRGSAPTGYYWRSLD